MNCNDIESRIEQILDSNDKGIEALVLDRMLKYGTFTLKERVVPNVRDGLKPVHKRFLYAMKVIGLSPNTAHKKCARIVGDTIGKYHPHGDSSVYDALVAYAQDFNRNLPLVDGEGNFGSIDGDNAAAYRYTEARLSKYGALFFNDFEKKIVPMTPNFDDTEYEPLYLPATFPNLLINGSYGIAVGMVSNIPLHNPNECMNAIKYIAEQKRDNKDVSSKKILSLVPAPDFPTGGIIYNTESMLEVIENGTGKMKLRAKMHIEKLPRNKSAIIITDLPYQIKKAPVIEKIGALVRNRDIEGITKLRDDTSKNEIRIYIELKADIDPEFIWKKLLKETELEKTISYNCLVIDKDGEPRVLGVKSILESFVDFRKEIVINKYTYIKNKSESKLELMEGVLKALINIDQVVKIIKSNPDEERAINALIKDIGLTVKQAKAILELRLQKLIGKEQLKIEAGINELKETIANAISILESDKNQYNLIIEEFKDIKKIISRKRLTEISYENLELNTEDIIPEESLIISLSSKNYIKKELLTSSGQKEMELQEDDYIKYSMVLKSTQKLSVFTNKGKAYNIVSGNITADLKGQYIPNNLFDFEKDEHIINMLPLNKDGQVILSTSMGFIKKLDLSEISENTRTNGISVIKLNENEELLFASNFNEEDKVVMIGDSGNIIGFNINEVSLFGRNSRGVVGMKGVEFIKHISIFNTNEDSVIACVLEDSSIKPILGSEIKIQKRAGKGVKFNLFEKLHSIVNVNKGDSLLFKSPDMRDLIDHKKLFTSASKNSSIRGFGVKNFSCEATQKICETVSEN